MLRRACFTGLLAGAVAGFSKDKPKTQAVILVSVFREPGFATPGADILLEPDPTFKTSLKVKKMKVLSDSRGEGAFRVPAAAMRYTVSVRLQGFQPEQRTVTIAGEERQDVFVTLKPAPETR